MKTNIIPSGTSQKPITRSIALIATTTLLCALILFLALQVFKEQPILSIKKYIVGKYGDTLSYKFSDRRNFEIDCYISQENYVCRSKDESGLEQRILSIWGNESFLHEGDVMVIIGQHDFSIDYFDELVIAFVKVADYSDEYAEQSSLFVFELENNSWRQHEAIMIGSHELPILIDANKVRADRGLRGFYYEWFYESGAFVDQGYY